MGNVLDCKRLYGLVGYPLVHSLSSQFFNSKFASEGVDAGYVNFEIADVGLLPDVIAAHPNLSGLNVTAPFKQAVIPLLDELDETAREVDAVNVISVIRDGNNALRLVGHNTDVTAFGRTMQGMPLPGSAMVLGTGGGARAAAVALRRLGVEVQLVSRHKAQQVLVYEEITRAMVASCHLIVNATPLGKYPDVEASPDFPYRFLTPSHTCYDLNYNPEFTAFLKLGAQHGAKTRNGLEMLLLQAAESYEIWTRGEG